MGRFGLAHTSTGRSSPTAGHHRAKQLITQLLHQPNTTAAVASSRNWAVLAKVLVATSS